MADKAAASTAERVSALSVAYISLELEIPATGIKGLCALAITRFRTGGEGVPSRAYSAVFLKALLIESDKGYGHLPRERG